MHMLLHIVYSLYKLFTFRLSPILHHKCLLLLWCMQARELGNTLWALGSLRYDPACRTSSSPAMAFPSGLGKPIRVKGRGGGGGGSEACLAVSSRDSLAACIVNELMAGGGKKLGQVRRGGGAI